MKKFLQKLSALSNLSHAYLFVGYEGETKNELVGFFAKVLFCENRTGCGHCQACLHFQSDHHPDFLKISSQKGSLRIDTIREMTQKISLKPILGGRMVVFLPEAEQMTEGAANALLKTLEEPPPFVFFLLSTPVPERLPLTIRSRCQRIFIPHPLEEEKKEWGEILPLWREEILPALIQKNSNQFSTASSLAERCLKEWDDLGPFLKFLIVWWRDLAVYQSDLGGVPLQIASTKDLLPFVERRQGERTFREIDCILETERAIEGHVMKQLALERLFLNLL